MDVANDVLIVETTESVATVTLNRPEALNSLTTELKVRLRDAVHALAVDPAVRCVVLTGAGRGFCAGQDLVEHEQAFARPGDPLSTVGEHYNPLITDLVTMPKPVIAAVNGVAAGAGAGLACAADFRIASSRARFLLAFANVGLALDSGTSWTVQRLIGGARARALALLADTVDADAALQMGLVNAVVEPDLLLPAAYELAARLAHGPTLAYAAIKAQLDTAWSGTLAEALDAEGRLQSELGATSDHRNATAAFVAKQRPTFTGR